MEMTSYLGKLLQGLDSPFSSEVAQHPLASITARAWRSDATEPHRFPSGKLALAGQSTAAADAASERDFVAALCRADEEAGMFTAYYWAQAWASLRGHEPGSITTLFDHNRVATGCWVCDQYAPGAYLLVKGAITGIQSYLYSNIQAEQTGEAKQVGRRLRGRSFLVAALGDLLAEHIVEQLGLTQANILFVGGGHFNLLLPDSPALRDKLETTLYALDMALLHDFGLKLGVSLGEAPLDRKGLENIAPVFMAANDAMERAKNRRFGAHVSQILLNETLIEQTAPQKKTEPTEEEKAMEEAGRWIPKAAFILELRGSVSARQGINMKDRGGVIHLNAIGISLVFIKEEGAVPWKQVLSVLDEAQHRGARPVKLLRLNNTDFLPPADQQEAFLAYPLAYGFRMLGQYAPTDEKGGIMELSDLAALNSPREKQGGENEKDKPLAYPRLAAMRLDVDDLGALFAVGLGAKTDLHKTLALSREMQLFFGGYFNHLAKQHHLYIVYSGGDDAFVLGSWLNVLEFAQTLYTQFQQFTHANPHIGFSAGVYLAHPKYPIVKLAEEAAEQEGKAKDYKPAEGLDKNAICVFDHTLSWARFMEMMDFAKKLTNQVEGKGGSIRRSVLQHILAVIQAAVTKKDDFEFYRQLGRLHALLTRRGYLKNVEESSIVQQMLKDMSNFEQFKDYLVPLHYALYKTR